VKGHLRIVGARLYAQIPPGPLGLEAVARHPWYVLEHRGPQRSETEAIFAVVLEERRT
jgi:hypothetical protein